MSPRRPPSRIEKLADAHGHLLKAQQRLAEIDLRLTPTRLRPDIHAARVAVRAALANLQDAISRDLPGGKR